MNNETEKQIEDEELSEVDPEEESLTATGQILLGEIEKAGGILTGNPQAQAEGDYNIRIGNLRKETAEELIDSDSGEK
jgi:hypothetical protein